MIDSQHIQTVMQLLERMELTSETLDKAYADKNAEKFKKAKDELIDFQKKISDLMV